MDSVGLPDGPGYNVTNHPADPQQETEDKGGGEVPSDTDSKAQACRQSPLDRVITAVIH
jgi:hypothetical protein